MSRAVTNNDFIPQERQDDGTQTSATDATEDEVSIPDDSQGRIELATKTSQPYYVSKWNRLKRHYRDAYLDLFQDVSGTVITAKEGIDTSESQLGAMTWSAQEKQRFFSALDRRGRHDLPEISGEVGSKSQVEVADYLRQLRVAHNERQMFYGKPNNIADAEIPAAIEIGKAVEMKLDEAADALIAFQEQYDMTSAQESQGANAIIGKVVATQMDREFEETEQNEAEESSNLSNDSPKRERLFHVTKLLDLSEKIFMNHHDQSPWDHWSVLAEDGQTPAITQDTLDVLHDLVSSLTQRILQVAIYMSMCRQRALRWHNRLPSRQLITSDVEAALDVLRMPHDAWNFWTNLPRRNKLRIVLGSHEKGATIRKALSYDEVEAALAVRKYHGRRRSLSVSTNPSSSNSSINYESDSRGDDTSDLASEDETMGTMSDTQPWVEASESPSSNDINEHSNERGSSNLDEDSRPSTIFISRKRRRVMLEQAQDEYMEKVDKSASREEEMHLRQLLDLAPTHAIKAESPGSAKLLGPRPRALRKDKNELDLWSCSYQQEWEAFRDLQTSR